MDRKDSAPKLRILRELTRGKSAQVVLIGTFAVVSTASTLALPAIVGQLVAEVQRAGGLSGWVVLLVAAALGAAAAGAVATYLLSKLGLQLICRLRIRSMRHSLGLRLPDARAEGTGNLATRLTADAGRLKSVIDVGPIQLPMAACTMAGTMVIMGLLDWLLLLVTFVSFALAVAIVVFVVRGLRSKYRTLQAEVAELTQRFVTALESLTVIKACRAEDLIADRLADRARKVARVDTGAARLEALMVPVITLGQQIALVTVVIGGGARLVSGALSLPSFVAFLLYLLQLTAPLMMAASGVSQLQVGLTARKRFDQLFAMPVEPAQPVNTPAAGSDGGVQPLPNAPALRFNGVHFAYGDRPALRGIEFTVPRRGLTAMVGLSGSGKTTALGLIERFIIQDTGKIELFGHDAEAWELPRMREQIAYVDQASTLLQDSVRNNVVLGRREPVPDEEVWRALERVGLAAEVDGLPDGLDTMLDGGTDLSGGQRQRLALARALVAKKPLVLLDEPSSQLDSLNEQKLREVVDELAEYCAVLVVAHRISTVQHAAQVIVVEAGKTVVQGTHEDLIREAPTYAELVSGQLIDRMEPALS